MARPLRLSVTLPSFSATPRADWGTLFVRAEAADRAGVDRVLVSDHVAFGEHMEAYGDPRRGGTEGGRQPTGPDGEWLEPLTVLAAIASRTSRVRLGTHVLLAALRHPVVLHKTVSTLDVLSGGRLDLGVGVGWQREEYLAVGHAFEARGSLLDETLHQLRELWGEQPVPVAGTAIHSMPQPRQPGGVPVWISGTANRRVAERLVRFGSGWIPWGSSARDLTEGMALMGDLVAEAGGSLDGVPVLAPLAPVVDGTARVDWGATMAQAAALGAVGVTDLHVTVRLADDAQAFDVYRAMVEARDDLGDC